MERLAADLLLGAHRDRVPCAPVRDLIGAADVVTAYEVQRLVTAARCSAGAAVVGRKIGLTSEAVRTQLGVDSPDFGVLLDDMAMTEDWPIPLDLLLQPRIEAEVAFVLSDDVDDPDVDLAGVVAYASPALEVVDSRIAGWDITLGDTIADNASSGLFVLGRAKVPLAEFDPVATRMVMTRGGEVVSRGTGADCLGDPLAALRWLAVTACETGSPLLGGQVVLSGALGPMVAVRGGDAFRAHLTGLGDVSASFTTREDRA
ncbi:2-keto-4-pentenoate hydratase [Umezawaea sp.]|uniref:2-keto-4-pentenoate hydratase n=1 Tax=Umezawaea sp. TaxID=1955258 RepID=UPI002ED045BE